LDEANIISRLQDGDEAAFKELVNSFKDHVFNTALGMLQQEADAEDVAQEVFIQVYQSIGGFKGNAKLSTWLYRITINKSLELLRNRKRKKRFAFIQSLTDDAGAEVKTKYPSFDHPGVRLENKERAAILFSAIEQLPEKQKIAFLLSKTEQLSYEQISEVMGQSLPAIESLLFRAKQNLQRILANYYENNER
jgi:RNA polymerase sigma factor (sigma-70 family)